MTFYYKTFDVYTYLFLYYIYMCKYKIYNSVYKSKTKQKYQ